MPDAAPTPIPDSGANAEATFVARNTYQSDATLAAAYLTAHPEEAKSFGVNLPTPQATPTYVPGTATAGGKPDESMAPDLSILNKDAQGKPLPAGVPGPSQEALQAPAIDPTMVIGGGVAGGLEGGVAAGVKAAGQSAIAQEVQDAASKVTGLATNNPYLKGLVGLVAPIALSILAKRGISAGSAEGEPAMPQGTVLNAQGEPVTSAPAGEAAPVTPSGAATEQPGSTPGASPNLPALPEQVKSNLTPEVAAQSLAEKQIEALKTARVGAGVAEEFGRPDIATKVPESLTMQEGQALRESVESRIPKGAVQPTIAAHTSAYASVFHDENAAIRSEATRISAAQQAGQDVTADKAALANRFAAYAVNYASLAGMRSDVGRALQILDPLKPQNVLATETAKLAQSLNPDDIDTLVDRLSRLEPEQQAAMARQVGDATAQGRSISGMLREYYYNALLSKPSTLVKKMAGDMTSWALNVPTRAIAARIPSWGSAAPLARGEGSEFAYGSAEGFGDALRVARNTWNLGSSAIDALGGGAGGEFEAPMPPEIRGSGKGGIMDTGADLLGDVVRTPTRAIATVHEFSRFVNFRGELRALALRGATSEADAQGLTGSEAGNYIAQRTEELANNPTPELMQAAHANANYNVFSQPLGATGQAFNDWLDKLPAGLGRLAFPFRRVPVNLAKFAMGYSPLSLATKSFYSAMQEGGANGQLALAKLGMGSAAMLMIGRAYMDGLITGGGPSDPKQYHDMLGTGWKPYAIKDGDNYFTYQNLEPLAMPLGLAADFATIMSNAPQADVEHAAVAGAVALGRNMSRQSYVETLANITELMDGLRTGTGMQSALSKFGAQELSGVIPSALRGEAKREDSVMRDTRGFFDTLLSKIPGYSKDMPPKVDLEGNPILTPPGFLANEVYPFQIGAEAHNPIADEILKTDAAPQKPPPLLPGSGSKAPNLMSAPDASDIGIPMTKQDQYQWQMLRATLKDDDGLTMGDNLRSMFASPDYQTLAREDKAKAIEKTVLQFGKVATNQLVASRPDLQRMLALRQQYKALGHLPEGQDPNEFLRSNGIEPVSAGGMP